MINLELTISAKNKTCSINASLNASAVPLLSHLSEFEDCLVRRPANRKQQERWTRMDKEMNTPVTMIER